MYALQLRQIIIMEINKVFNDIERECVMLYMLKAAKIEDVTHNRQPIIITNLHECVIL